MIKEFLKKLFAYNCICCGRATQRKSDIFCIDCTQIIENEFIQGKTGNILWCLSYKSQLPQDFILYMKNNNDKAAFELAAKFIHKRLLYEGISDINDYYITFAPRKPVSRLKYRFDQSQKIAESFSEIFLNSKDRCINTIDRSIFSKEQKLLTYEERIKNLSKKLRIKKYYKKHPLPKKLIIVDDVTTTGTTLEKVRQLLLDSGVESCITIALCGTNWEK